MPNETAKDAELLRAFEDGTILATGFHHADHVRVAWLCLHGVPVPEALSKFSSGLRRLAASVGQPGKYHETITFAYLLLINERMERTGRHGSWEEFARANPDLLRFRPTCVLDVYYRKETLDSELARRTYVLPDRLVPPWAHS